ncbi:MAG: HAD-IIIC family phosphatase [Acidobacteriota bacterium]
MKTEKIAAGTVTSSHEMASEVRRLAQAGSVPQARALLARFWKNNAGLAAAGFVNSVFEELRGAELSLASVRLAILRSCTFEPLISLLRAEGYLGGMDIVTYLSEFNTYAQEILEPGSPLYAHKPDVAILAVQTRDIVPALWTGFADLRPQDVERLQTEAIERFRNWIEMFRKFSNASLIVHTLEVPPWPQRGLLDAQTETSQAGAIRHINAALAELARETKGVYMLDYDALVARHGRLTWADEEKWLTVRLPMAAPNMLPLVKEWLRFLHPLSGKIAKVLVLDLDNTLWGGTIAEDGMAGIKLGAEHPGAAYQALQRVALDLYRRGILLAVCSKNNGEDALAVLNEHPGMILRPEHFAAMRINWQPKPQNLLEIADELNLGLDALAFLDDEPVERERVMQEVPEVWVIDPGVHPTELARIVREMPIFERLSLSEEDSRRGALYAAERQRRDFEHACSSAEDFYHSLQQRVEIAPVTPVTLARVAQLTQKTNQFNMTTHRYTEQQIQELSDSPDWHVLSLRVRDRFADNGLVGVAITRDDHVSVEIDTFLLSCRVIGRTVETALLAHLVQQARFRGIRFVQASCNFTKKNLPARDFYRRHGFQCLEETHERSVWRLDLATADVRFPEWISLMEEAA